MSVRLALVEPHEMFAETLDIALSMHGHTVVQVVLADPAPTPEALAEQVLATRPAVAVVDVDLDLDGSPARLVGLLAQAGVAVVALTGLRDHAWWGQCLDAGARRVVPKTASLRAVVSTLRRIESGLPVIPADQRRALISVWRRELDRRCTARQRLATLSRRESQVLAHLTSGRGVREIARVDFVSEATVRTQVKAILQKLEVGSQLAAVGVAHRVGWRVPEMAQAS